MSQSMMKTTSEWNENKAIIIAIVLVAMVLSFWLCLFFGK
jgi:hypothetical protein